MRFVLLPGVALLLFAGCGERLPVAPVSGSITLDGKPLTGASITTQPIGMGSSDPGPGSFGRTDAEGRFELELVMPAIPGAIIGEHRVMISPTTGDTAGHESQRSADGEYEYWSDAPQSRRAVNRRHWPTRLTDGSLRLEVPAEGTSDVRFDLTR